MLAHLAGDVCQHLMLALLKLNPKHRVRQGLEDFGHDFYRLFLRHTIRSALAFTGKLHIIARVYAIAKPLIFTRQQQLHQPKPRLSRE